MILERETSAQERAFLLAHDTDPFNKWESGRTLARDVLIALITGEDVPLDDYLHAIAVMLRDDSLDPAFRALTLGLPGQDDLAQTLYDAGVTPDPMKIYRAKQTLWQAMAEHLQDLLPRLMAEMEVTEPFQPNAEQAGKRALGLGLMNLLNRLDGGAAAQALYDRADNMTLRLGALGLLLQAQKGDAALADFRAQFEADELVMDKWFAMQVTPRGPRRDRQDRRQTDRRQRLQLEKPEPLPRGVWRVHHEPGGVPQRVWRGLQTVCRLADQTGPGEPANHGAHVLGLRDMAAIRCRPSGHDENPDRAGAGDGRPEP